MGITVRVIRVKPPEGISQRLDIYSGHDHRVPGCAKCLVMLGISQQKLTQIIHQEMRGLQHLDVEVLALEVMEQSAGILIAEKLRNLALIVGTPMQM